MGQSHLIREALDLFDLRMGADRLERPVAMGVRVPPVQAQRTQYLAPLMLLPAMVAQQAGDEEVGQLIGGHPVGLQHVPAHWESEDAGPLWLE